MHKIFLKEIQGPASGPGARQKAFSTFEIHFEDRIFKFLIDVIVISFRIFHQSLQLLSEPAYKPKHAVAIMTLAGSLM